MKLEPTTTSEDWKRRLIAGVLIGVVIAAFTALAFCGWGTHTPSPFCVSIFSAPSFTAVADLAPSPSNLSCSKGALAAGGDIAHLNMTIPAATLWCASHIDCGGFTARAAYPLSCSTNGTEVRSVYFKSQLGGNTDPSWTTWRKPGWTTAYYHCVLGTCRVCPDPHVRCDRVTYVSSDCFALCPPPANGSWASTATALAIGDAHPIASAVASSLPAATSTATSAAAAVAATAAAAAASPSISSRSTSNVHPTRAAFAAEECFVDPVWPASEVLVSSDVEYGQAFNNQTRKMEILLMDIYSPPQSVS